jgi:hypothetical protein
MSTSTLPTPAAAKTTPHGHAPAMPKGEFTTLDGVPCYLIRHVDHMPAFFISVVSHSNHWMFLTSQGGLTAGRIDSDHSLFPYETVDKVQDGLVQTGPFTLLRISTPAGTAEWQPWNPLARPSAAIERNLYKSVWGNQITFEEINHPLQLRFRYRWSYSDTFGFVRRAELESFAQAALKIEILDGLRNLLPSGVDARTQQAYSSLADAYKRNELIPSSTLALYTLAARIIDQAIPMESLRATTVWSHGLDNAQVLLTDAQRLAVLDGQTPAAERVTKGIRGSYLLHAKATLLGGATLPWTIVAEVEQDQPAVAKLLQQLKAPAAILKEIDADVAAGTERLQALIGMVDGHQTGGDRKTTVHHFANALFNAMRGGVMLNGYEILGPDFAAFIKIRNIAVAKKHAAFLQGLPAALDRAALEAEVKKAGDLQLERLFLEYLPLTFSRRHGDPSRPWNRFAIHIKDAAGNPVLNYQGNWRDIFQNWEALALSYPDFTGNMIAKFVNASTPDGYNPYRITREGIDWEQPEPHDPWASIGYWGDHQLIYLLKLMELSHACHPGQLDAFLDRDLFSYADVPYRIKSYAEIVKNPRDTIDFDVAKNRETLKRAAAEGSDARLVQTAQGEVYQVNLTEKLLASLLAKVANFIPGAGVWMNTQRPEWNDANNALVGFGVSIVTLGHLRRYLGFCRGLFAAHGQTGFKVSTELAAFFQSVSAILQKAEAAALVGDAAKRRAFVDTLGQAAEAYRAAIYARGFTGRGTVKGSDLLAFFDAALTHADLTLRANLRKDGLFHSYNLVHFDNAKVEVQYLPEMIEGQVSVLGSGMLSPEESLQLLKSLPASALYRADQQSYLLYPNRELPDFLAKNRIPEQQLRLSKLLTGMLAAGDTRIVEKDAAGDVRFNADFVNAQALKKRLESLEGDAKWSDLARKEQETVLSVYETVFNHRAFTGRSGSMFAFEGLGSIYWHMVSKLLLAAQEAFFQAVDAHLPEAVIQDLAKAYYEIRRGIGFNKTPAVYGAFPCDPYSHTPAHAGAQQPGMTGQVKEELLTRLGELGLRIKNGILCLQPVLLREDEFLTAPTPFTYFDVTNTAQTVLLPADTLGFTFCQVPVIYHRGSGQNVIILDTADGKIESSGTLTIPAEIASRIFARDGFVRRIEAKVVPGQHASIA